MKRNVFLGTLLLLGPVAAPTAWPQQQPAIPTTVKSLIKSPPKVGQLVQVSGYLVTTDMQPKLQDNDSERKIILDFSKSQVTLAKLGANQATSPPVLVIGRMQDSKDNGKPILAVVGAINLTP